MSSFPLSIFFPLPIRFDERKRICFGYEFAHACGAVARNIASRVCRTDDQLDSDSLLINPREAST